MKIAVVSAGGVPNPTSGGGALTQWTVISHLLAQGHEVTVCPVVDEDYWDPAGADATVRAGRLRALGAEVRPVVTRRRPAPPRGCLSGKLRRAWRPPDEQLYPNLLDAEAVREAVEEIAPDVAWVYHFEALAASHALRSVPRFAAVGDPSHLPLYWRWRLARKRPSLDTLRLTLRVQAAWRHYPRLMAELLGACEATGAFAAHHAAWLRERCDPRCEYLRTPVPDPGGGRPPARNERPRILLLGHLRGAVTVDGLRVFARMLPHLDRLLGRDGYEVRVVGGFEPPEELRRLLSHPALRLLGHVEDPAEEIGSAEVMLVPTSIPLGIRVRILTGFSFGACVVTHRANALGIPELADGENALLAPSPEGLAAAVARATGHEELRERLGAGARATYERFFSPIVAAGRIETKLEELAARREAVAR